LKLSWSSKTEWSWVDFPLLAATICMLAIKKVPSIA
jgi:hypothetical protein